MKQRLRKIGNIKHNKQYAFYCALNEALSIAIIRYELKGKI